VNPGMLVSVLPWSVAVGSCAGSGSVTGTRVEGRLISG
jgi:hypothetical protein